MIKKGIFLILIAICLILIGMNTINAATYTIDNSTKVITISKMIEGKIPLINNKTIANGDTVKFKAGKYYNIRLNVKKQITLTTTKNSKNKVIFIGNYTKDTQLHHFISSEGSDESFEIMDNKTPFIDNSNCIAIDINSNKVKIIGITLNNYYIGISGKTDNSYISKNYLFKNIIGISVNGNKNIFKFNNLMRSSLSVNGNKNNISHNHVKHDFIGASGKNNLISYNNVSYYYLGIHINGTKNTVRRNIAKHNTFGLVINGNKNLVRFNKLYNNSCGIDISGNKNNVKFNKLKEIIHN
ncbi:right-handed parallel beta-helix repeat-containing protein [Methanobrevibacter filiformis]|nr:hypothetical protein [Methanobrevibacter filiformis]